MMSSDSAGALFRSPRQISWKTSAVYIIGLLALLISLLSLAVLLIDIFQQGSARLGWDFLNHFPSRHPEQAGVKSAFVGTIWIMGLTAVIAIPLGVMAAIYLEEYANDNWLKRLIQINIANLSGVPSIIYGMLGLAVFVRALDLGRSILAGALTMSLLILPMIVIATQEALRAVPASLRQAAYGLGASRRQVVWSQTLPEALPGILTGIILALSRAIGESAPLILIGALSFVAFVPASPNDSFTVLAIQIFNWAGRPQEEFHAIAATAIIVLLAFVLSMNILATYMRLHFKRQR